jgi:hypothetical protein
VSSARLTIPDICQLVYCIMKLFINKLTQINIIPSLFPLLLASLYLPFTLLILFLLLLLWLFFILITLILKPFLVFFRFARLMRFTNFIHLHLTYRLLEGLHLSHLGRTWRHLIGHLLHSLTIIKQLELIGSLSMFIHTTYKCVFFDRLHDLISWNHIQQEVIDLCVRDCICNVIPLKSLPVVLLSIEIRFMSHLNNEHLTSLGK